MFDLFVGERGRCGEEECMITLWGQKGVLDHSRGLEYRGGEGK